MAGPNHGALGASFKVVRVFQTMCLVAIIGMTANFIAQMVSSNSTPQKVLVGTISVTCIAVLYCAITFILFIDDILPFLINAGMDGLLLIAVIVVAVVVGKPLSYIDCSEIGTPTFTAPVTNSVTPAGSSSDMDRWDIAYGNSIGASKSNCLELKSIWGLSIALCILFAFSATFSVCLWRQKQGEPPKDIEHRMEYPAHG